MTHFASETQQDSEFAQRKIGDTCISLKDKIFINISFSNFQINVFLFIIIILGFERTCETEDA